MKLVLVACVLLLVSTACAAAPLTLFESQAPRAEERAFIARLRSELQLLGIEVDVRTGPSAEPRAELDAWPHDTGRAAAALRLDADGAALLFAPSQVGSLSVFPLGHAYEHDPSRWAAQAAEVLRPQLLGEPVSSVQRPREHSSPDPTLPRAAQEPPADTGQGADSELPPGLQGRPDVAPTMPPPPRFVGEIGIGFLISPQAMPPQATLSALVAMRLMRWLRLELWALAPLYPMARGTYDESIEARASVMGGGLQFIVSRQPRWDLAAALGAGPSVVAHRDVGTIWSRSVSLSLYARVTGGIQLPHALSLRLDVSAGTLFDAVLLGGEGAPSWGRLWIGSTLGLLAAFD